MQAGVEEKEEEMAAAVEAGEADAALVVACREVGFFLQVAAHLALALRPRRRNNHRPRRARRAPSTAGASPGTSGSTERSVGVFSGRGSQAAIGVHGTA